jgi:uncharacterized membrane protein
MMSNQSRFALLDAARGTAIAMMFSFHFCFDLNYFGFTHWNFYTDPFWLHYRTVIVSSFLLVMGVSLYLAHHRAIRWRQYRRRLLILALCAGLVSASSYFFAHERFIFFGILHFITVASLLGLLFLRLYWINLGLGVLLITLGSQIKLAFFDQPLLQWFGLMTHKPITEDYVPLLPWFGVVLLGLFFAHFAYTRQHFLPLFHWRLEQPLARLLRLAGRHSLLIYMVHQPIFLGILYTLRQVIP